MKITIFSTKSCAYCNSLKKWLNDKSISYIDYDINQNSAAAASMVKLSGQTSVPFSIVEYGENKMMKVLGFDRQKIESAIAEDNK